MVFGIDDAAFATLGAAALNGASSIGTGFLNNMFAGKSMLRQYKYQRSLQEHAAQLNYNYGIKQAQELPQATRKGLESAGYNPLLAIGNFNTGNGFTSAGSAGLATPQVDSGNLGGDIVNAYRAFQLERKMNAKQIDQIDSVIKTNEANAALASQQAQTEQNKRDYYQSQVALNNIDTRLKNEELPWVARKRLMEIKTGYQNAQANFLGAEAQKLNSSANWLASKGSYYYNTHRALGFSTTESGTESRGGSRGFASWHFKDDKSSSWSRSQTY